MELMVHVLACLAEGLVVLSSNARGQWQLRNALNIHTARMGFVRKSMTWRALPTAPTPCSKPPTSPLDAWLAYGIDHCQMLLYS